LFEVKLEKSSKKFFLFPIIIILIYLMITQFSYAVFQIDSPGNKFITLGYTSFCYFMLLLGYCVALKRRNFEFKKIILSTRKVNAVVGFSAILTIIISLNTIMSYYVNVSEILKYLSNPGLAYEHVKFLNRHERMNETILDANSSFKSIIGVTLTVFSFTKYFLFAFIVLYWKRLFNLIKFISLFGIVFYLIQSLLVGSMINIALIVFTLIPVIIYKSKNSHNPKSKSKHKLKINRIIFLGIFFTLILSYFLGSRDVFQISYDGPFYVILSGLFGLVSYISHGYVGLSGALQLEFIPTFGQSSFRGIVTKIQPFLGFENMFLESYLVRHELATGWPALQRWSTIFPWIASDFSFVLVPIIMFMIGNFFKNVWKEAIKSGNPYAIVLMGHFFGFGFMIPANNFLFHTFGNSMSTIIIILLYIKSSQIYTVRK
jgi:hypothetical protein